MSGAARVVAASVEPIVSLGRVSLVSEPNG
jgi:hypothetical protein